MGSSRTRRARSSLLLALGVWLAAGPPVAHAHEGHDDTKPEGDEKEDPRWSWQKKAGYGGIKAGAIETASSVNGQIMPPVMGAAAFLMVEYVGIPYTDIVKHAFLPAAISYIALFYIVHLEALRMGMAPR